MAWWDGQIRLWVRWDKGLDSFRSAATAEGPELEKVILVVETPGLVEPGEVLISLVATSQGRDLLHLWAVSSAIALRVWSGWSSASQIFTPLTMSSFTASLGRPKPQKGAPSLDGSWDILFLYYSHVPTWRLLPTPPTSSNVHLHINRGTFNISKGF